VVGPNQFKVNVKIIDLPNDGEKVTCSVVEPAHKLLLYFARKGCGETQVAKGLLSLDLMNTVRPLMSDCDTCNVKCLK